MSGTSGTFDASFTTTWKRNRLLNWSRKQSIAAIQAGVSPVQFQSPPPIAAFVLNSNSLGCCGVTTTRNPACF